jgi:hypothetical protein
MPGRLWRLTREIDGESRHRRSLGERVMVEMEGRLSEDGDLGTGGEPLLD